VPNETSISPRITVVMPAFNGEANLPNSIGSLLSQEYQDWELIVVNDGSTDGTRRYLDELLDTRIRVLHQDNRGVSAARNAALDIAKGEFITFLDADDVLPAQSLESRARYFDAHPETTIVDCVITVRDARTGRTLRERWPGTPGAFFPRLIRLDESVFFGPFVMLRRKALAETRFREGLTHCEDILFLLEASDSADWQYGAVNVPAYCYCAGDGSAMADMDGLEAGYISLYKACRELRQTTAPDLDYLYRRIRRILVRSWLRRGKPHHAWAAWRKLRTAREPAISS
jgi:teichuronic acid biosynthesis glycosyltransferase TuaG